MTAAVLETRHLNKSFGALKATTDVSFRLEKGARHALIGPNGAGKTTFINLLTGVLAPSGGQVFLNGEDISSLKRERRVHRGLVRTFQINQLFGELNVVESLGLGAIPADVKNRSLRIGAATEKALGMARSAFNEDLQALALPVLEPGKDSPPAAAPKDDQRTPR